MRSLEVQRFWVQRFGGSGFGGSEVHRFKAQVYGVFVGNEPEYEIIG